jgi:hypothetical protein
MPKGKKRITVKEFESVVKTLEENKKPLTSIVETKLCNHQNRHYTAGELTCVLPKNHGGDHLGYVNGNPTAWSDAAGTPARRHA